MQWRPSAVNRKDEIHQLIFLTQKLKKNAQGLFSQVARKYDLSFQKVMVLIAIHSQKADTVTGLSNEFSLHQANVSSLVKIMEKEGLIVRTISEEDIRVNILSLTKPARKIMSEIYYELVQRIEENEEGIDFDLIKAGLAEMSRFLEGML